MAKRQVDYLNNASPLSKEVALGDKLDAIITSLNALVASAQGGTHVRKNIVFSNTTTSLAVAGFSYVILGVPAFKQAATVALTTTTHNVATTKWASFRVSIASGGTITITKAADQNTQADAIANLAAVPAGEADLGYFTIRGGDSAGFVAGTTNLATAAITGMVVNYFPAKSVLALVAALV